MTSSFKGVPAGVKRGCLDAATGTAVGVCAACAGSAAGGDAFAKVAFYKVFEHWTLFWGRGFVVWPGGLYVAC